MIYQIIYFVNIFITYRVLETKLKAITSSSLFFHDSTSKKFLVQADIKFFQNIILKV